MPLPAGAGEAPGLPRAAGDEETGPLVERGGPQRPSRAACRGLGLALAGAVALAAVPCLVARSRAPAGAHGEPARAAPVRALFVSVAEAAAARSRALEDTDPDCNTKEAWPKEKQDWCCEHKNKGCEMDSSGGDYPTTTSPATHPNPDGHDCDTKEVWTKEKQEYCCSKENKGCNMDTSGQTDCDTKEVWTTQKKEYCCSKENKGCNMDTSGQTDCNTKEVWTTEKKEYCCTHENKGCEMNSSGGGGMGVASDGGGLFNELAKKVPKPTRA